VVHEAAPKGDAGDAAPPDDAGDETVVCQTSGQDVGAVADFAVGTWKEVGTLIVGHDSKGIFAFSAVCTHAGCIVNPPSKNGSTFCPCHGSQFDGNGSVLVGPAFSPLEHYAVEICNGNVLVDTSSVVSASSRTPVP
jgi:Rieske Fe-S protein